VSLPVLQHRHLQPELMDDASLSKHELFSALTELERLNRLSFTSRQLASAIKQFAKKRNRHSIHLFDIACADGALLSELSQLISASGLEVSGVGVDINPHSIARARLRAQPSLQFEVSNVLTAPLPQTLDIVISSLFFHHLSEKETSALFTKLWNAEPNAIFISDLKRNRWGYALAYIATRLCCRSKIVRYDALQSVKAAYSTEELIALATSAGFSSAIMKSMFPSRFLFQWENGSSWSLLKFPAIKAF